jgi:hypothetical protein
MFKEFISWLWQIYIISPSDGPQKIRGPFSKKKKNAVMILIKFQFSLEKTSTCTRGLKNKMCFVTTGFTGQTNFTAVWYSPTINGLLSNNSLRRKCSQGQSYVSKNVQCQCTGFLIHAQINLQLAFTYLLLYFIATLLPFTISIILLIMFLFRVWNVI